MPAKWSRLDMMAVPAPAKLMATRARKHITIFVKHKPRKPPGRLEVKNAFRTAAATTGGEPIRSKRNEKLKAAMLTANVKTGIYYKRSKSKYAPLTGKRYKLSKGQSVGAAIAVSGLSAILVD
jgi:hypothetical protein